MELIKNLRWMCRICTVNTKKRKTSTRCAVSIIETPELVEKLKNYLFIEIDPVDDLPKKICTNCYDRIESFHNFVSLANKTENFYKELINYAKGNPVDNTSTEKFQKEFASFALLKAAATTVAATKLSKTKNKLSNNNTYASNNSSSGLNNDLSLTPLHSSSSSSIVGGATPLLTSKQQHQKQQQQQQKQLTPPVNDAGELILNVSVSDPLIKDIENKIELASKRRSSEMDNNSKKSTKAQKTKQLNANNNSNSANKNESSQSNQQQQSPPINNFIIPPLSSEDLCSAANIAAAANFVNFAVAGHASYDSLNLGSVIKDMDLLKLILKALKWTYTNSDSLNAQIIRLKNTRLRDVITDPNLLQDADMTQILRSYLSPVLLQSQHQNLASLFSSPTSLLPLTLPHPTTAANAAATAAALSSLSSYKIPSDTSVQLISVPSESNNSNYQNYSSLHHNQNYSNSKSKVRRMSTSPIVLSDDSNDEQMEVSVDPSLYFPGDKEFFFHHYNNTDFMQMENGPSVKKENSKTKSRKKHKNKDNFGSKSNSKNRKKSINKTKLNDEQQLQLQQQHQQQLLIQQQQLQQQLLQQQQQLQQHQLQQQKQEQQQQQQKQKQKSHNKNVVDASKNQKEPTVIQDPGFKDFDIDSITLIEEASDDDEIWADFKVSESGENSDNDDNKDIKNIKKEKIDESEVTQSTKRNPENEDNNVSSACNLTSSTPISSKRSKTKNDNIEEPSQTKITDNQQQELNTTITQTPKKTVLKEEINPEATVSSTTKSRKRKSRKSYPTSGRVTRPKTPRTYFKTRRTNGKKTSESPKSPNQSLESNKEENSEVLSSSNIDNNVEENITTVVKEELTKSNNKTSTIVESTRKPNTRKRICKQCGLTFMNITDFVEHRKQHM